MKIQYNLGWLALCLFLLSFFLFLFSYCLPECTRFILRTFICFLVFVFIWNFNSVYWYMFIIFWTGHGQHAVRTCYISTCWKEQVLRYSMFQIGLVVYKIFNSNQSQCPKSILIPRLITVWWGHLIIFVWSYLNEELFLVNSVTFCLQVSSLVYRVLEGRLQLNLCIEYNEVKLMWFINKVWLIRNSAYLFITHS